MAERNAENFKFLQKEIINIYKKYTKIQKLEEKLLADNYMVNGGEAMLKAGLIDEIII
jgi:ATP-dependent protease ClpP protease subunit